MQRAAAVSRHAEGPERQQRDALLLMRRQLLIATTTLLLRLIVCPQQRERESVLALLRLPLGDERSRMHGVEGRCAFADDVVADVTHVQDEIDQLLLACAVFRIVCLSLEHVAPLRSRWPSLNSSTLRLL